MPEWGTRCGPFWGEKLVTPEAQFSPKTLALRGLWCYRVCMTLTKNESIIHTFTGVAVGLADVAPVDIITADIVQSLRVMPRFNGHLTCTTEAWNVLKHSEYVRRLVAHLGGDHVDCLAALLHDAHEAYIGDIPTPVKLLLGTDTVHALTGRIDEAVADRYELPGGYVFRSDRVKEADHIALQVEAYWLLATHGAPHINPGVPFTVDSSHPYSDLFTQVYDTKTSDIAGQTAALLDRATGAAQ